jgi:hypothetical protein
MVRKQSNKKGNMMKLDIDWAGLAKAVAKAIWPFLTGALAGFLAGCTVGGVGPNFFGA